MRLPNELRPAEKDDASTGLGQIFASTAIDARNSASATGLTDEPHIDPGDWHQVWNVWRSLHDDEYNISTVPLVLLRNADMLSITTHRWTTTRTPRSGCWAGTTERVRRPTGTASNCSGSTASWRSTTVRCGTRDDGRRV